MSRRHVTSSGTATAVGYMMLDLSTFCAVFFCAAAELLFCATLDFFGCAIAETAVSKAKARNMYFFIIVDLYDQGTKGMFFSPY